MILFSAPRPRPVSVLNSFIHGIAHIVKDDNSPMGFRFARKENEPVIELDELPAHGRPELHIFTDRKMADGFSMALKLNDIKHQVFYGPVIRGERGQTRNAQILMVNENIPLNTDGATTASDAFKLWEHEVGTKEMMERFVQQMISNAEHELQARRDFATLVWQRRDLIRLLAGKENVTAQITASADEQGFCKILVDRSAVGYLTAEGDLKIAGGCVAGNWREEERPEVTVRKADGGYVIRVSKHDTRGKDNERVWSLLGEAVEDAMNIDGWCLPLEGERSSSLTIESDPMSAQEVLDILSNKDDLRIIPGIKQRIDTLMEILGRRHYELAALVNTSMMKSLTDMVAGKESAKSMDMANYENLLTAGLVTKGRTTSAITWHGHRVMNEYERAVELGLSNPMEMVSRDFLAASVLAVMETTCADISDLGCGEHEFDFSGTWFSEEDRKRLNVWGDYVRYFVEDGYLKEVDTDGLPEYEITEMGRRRINPVRGGLDTDNAPATRKMGG